MVVVVDVDFDGDGDVNAAANAFDDDVHFAVAVNHHVNVKGMPS